MKDGRKYTPSKSKNYENAVAIYAKQVMASDPKMLGPVSMTVRLCMKMPESWSKKRKDEALSGKIAATKKPDCSNVIKGIEDAMNGVVYRDDSQIIEQIIIKRYSAAPQAIITVAEVSASPAP
ncbi:MAG: RusA family crossover junction endodeoxyribonuclease [Candidatus Thiodiazotropha sp. (ex Troendleina suluensis)]|nr:RusA family crossover junction endodeoxyribonuclease [Candidatus Thiodiazotropha sp. (ex Troendleina suluensis)]